ncbi:MAG: hypothetical protein WDO70_05685 [Alphaproteobacteria bacterium]
MSWTVGFTNKADKQVGKLPRRERDLLDALVKDLIWRGAILPDWRNYSKLGPNLHHCHLSYKWVACWRANSEEIVIYYVGSRENAPY